MWIKALLALAPVALFLAVPAPVAHADGACTALGNDANAYNDCMVKMNVHCVGHPGGVYPTALTTCKYPDGGRDDCFVNFGLVGTQVVDSSCTYFPPGSEPAPAPVPGGAPEPAAEPATAQP